MNEKTSCVVAVLLWILPMVVILIFTHLAINPERHESDPAVYERYVEDMYNAGRKPNGEPLDPDVFGGKE